MVAANLISTSAGMAFSFVANGRWTFAGRLTFRAAALFLTTTGATMWVLQPAVIEALLRLWGDGGTTEVLGAKVLAIGVSVAANFAVPAGRIRFCRFSAFETSIGESRFAYSSSRFRSTMIWRFFPPKG